MSTPSGGPLGEKLRGQTFEAFFLAVLRRLRKDPTVVELVSPKAVYGGPRKQPDAKELRQIFVLPLTEEPVAETRVMDYRAAPATGESKPTNVAAVNMQRVILVRMVVNRLDDPERQMLEYMRLVRVVRNALMREWRHYSTTVQAVDFGETNYVEEDSVIKEATVTLSLEEAVAVEQEGMAPNLEVNPWASS